MLNELILGRALYVRSPKDEGSKSPSRIVSATRGAWQWLVARP
ncbi:hypothetical protein ACSSVZ_000218 [Amorphus sp. MBR-141]